MDTAEDFFEGAFFQGCRGIPAPTDASDAAAREPLLEPGRLEYSLLIQLEFGFPMFHC